MARAIQAVLLLEMSGGKSCEEALGAEEADDAPLMKIDHQAARPEEPLRIDEDLDSYNPMIGLNFLLFE